jgi:hypothetical protein
MRKCDRGRRFCCRLMNDYFPHSHAHYYQLKPFAQSVYQLSFDLAYVKNQRVFLTARKNPYCFYLGSITHRRISTRECPHYCSSFQHHSRRFHIHQHLLVSFWTFHFITLFYFLWQQMHLKHHVFILQKNSYF